jgi:hypothetical protein
MEAARSKEESTMKNTSLAKPALSPLLSLLFGLALLVSAPAVAYGQAETTGIISGTVADGSGGRIPGATVKIEGAAYSRTLTTDSEGFFRALLVPPGSYKVSVSAKGFSGANIEGVEVALGKTTPLEIGLKAGSISEQVNISADEVARIDPADNKIQTNISAKVIDALPKGTNMTSLLKILRQRGLNR